MSLKIENLTVKIENKSIIRNINLEFGEGKVYYIMGPNGSGKTTLCKALMGIGKYTINGRIILDGKDITNLKPWERVKLGLFVSYQHPVEIPEIKFRTFLAIVYESIHGSLENFNKKLNEYIKLLKIDEEFLERKLNYKFSGGEKKKSEILQMLLIEPKYIFLDEIDSGVDVDSLKLIVKAIDVYRKIKPNATLVIITHHADIAEYLKPDKAFVMLDGKIVKEGDKSLIYQILKKGYNE